MAIVDIEARLDPTVPPKTCAVCHYMAELGEAWTASIERMLRNRGIKFSAIADEFANDPDEPNIPAATLSRHAQRGCAAQVKLR